MAQTKGLGCVNYKNKYDVNKSDIQLWDWKRILIGDAPGIFMLEVFIQAIVMFTILFLAMRLLGKKMNAGVSIIEMAVVYAWSHCIPAHAGS